MEMEREMDREIECNTINKKSNGAKNNRPHRNE